MSEHVESVVLAAKAMLGWPYVLGGLTQKGIDCRGLVRKAFGNVGLRHLIGGALPNVREQVRWAKENGRFRDSFVTPERGWLVFYSGPYGKGPDMLQHVGIVLRPPSASRPRGRAISAVVPAVTTHRLVLSRLTIYGYCAPDWPQPDTTDEAGPISDPEPPVDIQPEDHVADTGVDVDALLGENAQLKVDLFLALEGWQASGVEVTRLSEKIEVARNDAFNLAAKLGG